MDKDIRDDRTCFICGEKNPIGLKLRLRVDSDLGQSSADVKFPEDFQGWAGVVHGGLVAAVLDEALIYAAGAKGIKCVTGEITVRYVKPTLTGVLYSLVGRLVEDQGRIVLAEGRLVDGEGQEVARASGKLFRVPGPVREPAR
jgi:uncharacterized protein (TIGR00369 family)